MKYTEINFQNSNSKELLKILRIPMVKAACGLGKSTIYLRISQGLWTRPISLGARTVGWPANEIHSLNAARISGKSDDEIRTLVMKLEAARKAYGEASL